MGNCPRVAGGVKPAWIAVAIEIISYLYDAYEAVKDNSGNEDQMLAAMNSKLDDISNKVNDIDNKVGEVITLLEALPKEIQGIVNAQWIHQQMIYARSNIILLQEKIQAPVMQQNFCVIGDRLDQVELYILNLMLSEPGYSTSLAIAPIFASWLAITVIYQLARAKSDPKWVIASPWLTKTTLGAQSQLGGFIEGMNQADQRFNSSIALFPGHMTPLSLVNGHLSNANIGNYRDPCPMPPNTERLQALRPPPPFTYQYFTAGSSDDQIALSDFAVVQQSREQAAEFYSAVAPLLTQEDKIMAIFMEPPGVWGAMSNRVQRGRHKKKPTGCAPT